MTRNLLCDVTGIMRKQHSLTPFIATSTMPMVMSLWKPSMEGTLRDCRRSSENMIREDGSINSFPLRECIEF